MFGRRLSLAVLCVAILCPPAQSKAAVPSKKQDDVRAMARYIDRRMVSSGLSFSPLRKEMIGIVTASKRSGLSPFFVLAISGVESTYGKAACGHNAWGWNSCHGYNFSSFSEGARVVAGSLKAHYLNRGLRTVSSVAPVYCPPGASRWASNVRYIMKNVFAAGEGLTWKESLRTIN